MLTAHDLELLVTTQERLFPMDKVLKCNLSYPVGSKVCYERSNVEN